MQNGHALVFLVESHAPICDGPSASDTQSLWSDECRPILLSKNIASVSKGLSGPFHGFLLIDENGAALTQPAMIRKLGEGGVVLSVTTSAAWQSDLSVMLSRGLADRYAIENHLDFQICIGEALANAIIHGNLDISGSDYERLRQENGVAAALRERLDNPFYATRRLEIMASVSKGGIEVTITDQGNGFVSDEDHSRNTPSGSSGRGLRLLRRLATSVHHSQNGRSLTFCFS